MRMKFYLDIGRPLVKSSFLFLMLFLFSSLSMGDVPIESDFLRVPNGRWIWLKKVGAHKTQVLLGKGKKSVRNKIWSKLYDSTDGMQRHTWAYAFFVRLKLDRFIDQDSVGNPKMAISTYDMGNGIVRRAIVYRVLNDRLEVVEEVDGFNVEADESVYEKRLVPRGLNPHFKISDIPKWVGKYSFHKIEGAALFSTKMINDYLKTVLGDFKYQEFLSIEDIGPQIPLESDAGVVHFSVCEKHNCGHMFYFLFKISTGRLFVCEREVDLDLKSNNASYARRATWFSEKGRHVIPNGNCEFYDEDKKETDWKRTYESIPHFL